MEDYDDPNVLPQDQQGEINAEVQQEAWDGVSEPKPVMFDDYDDYVKSLTDWKVRQVSEEISARQQSLPQRRGINPNADAGTILSEAMREALEADRAAQVLAQQQAQQDIGPVPDDPYGGKRAELERISNEFSMEAIKAKEAGDIKKYHEWRQRQVQYENELKALPPKPSQEFADAMVDQVDFRGINLLFDKNKAHDPMWNSPRMQHDAAIVVARHNSRSRHGAIALPAESSPFGNPLPVKPQHMVQVVLPQDQLQAFQNMVYRSGGDDSPDAVIRRSWRALHKLGYSGTVQPALEKKTAKKAEGEETDPDKMNWQEFVKWRTAQEERKRGKPRGFVFPKKRV